MSENNQPVIEYGVTDAALAELRERFAVVPDANTDEGYGEIKEALKVLTPLRTGVEKKRKELKADALAWSKKVDSAAKEITAKLLELETPLKAAKTEVDERKKRKEEERIARLKQKVESLRAYPQTAVGQGSAMISQLIEDLDAHQIEDYYDLSKEAAIVKQESLDKLAEMLQQAIAREAADEERRKMDEQLAEQRKEMERQQEEMRAQQAELDRQKRELEEANREAQNRSSIEPSPAPTVVHQVTEPEISQAQQVRTLTHAVIDWANNHDVCDSALGELMEILHDHGVDLSAVQTTKAA